MQLANEILDLVLDTGHIASSPRTAVSRWSVCGSYLRLHRKRLFSKGPGTVRLLGFDVQYLDPSNLSQLYREILVNRIYGVQLAGPAPVIVDCGANIGMSILFFKRLHPNARILAFEPNPLIFPVLQQNVARNGLRDVTLLQRALADTEGTIDFFVNREIPGALNSGMYDTRSGTTAISVPCDRLSKHLDGPVDLLKLDIEGAEELVLRDLAESGRLAQVRRIVCEYHHHHHRDSGADRFSTVLSTLEQNGFGYQLEACHGRARELRVYQDVLIYAYRKGAADPS